MTEAEVQRAVMLGEIETTTCQPERTGDRDISRRTPCQRRPSPTMAASSSASAP